jgi:nitrite reductase/ring-hydroxylating ferredoxin subunit
MAYVKVGSLSATPPGTVWEAEIDGRYYAVCNVEGTIHALDGTCPHRGGPVGQGALHGANLVCPWHAWEFDCATGAYDYNPDVKLEKFPVKVEEGDIFLDVG